MPNSAAEEEQPSGDQAGAQMNLERPSAEQIYRQVLTTPKMSWSAPLEGHNAHRELKEYEVVVAVVSAALYWFRVRLLPRANQIAVLTLCSVLLPPVSFEYTLVHLLLGWGVLSLVCVSAGLRGMVLPGSVTAMALYAVLNVDLFQLLKRWSVRYDAYVSYEGAVKMVLLLVLMAVVLRCPWPDADHETLHAG